MVWMDHELYPYETDVRGLLKPSELLRWSMRMSQLQQDSENVITPELIEKTHLGWMLARFCGVQRAVARVGDSLRVVCSPRAVQRAYYIREALISRGEEVLARVRMVWIPVDMETRRILRVPELEQLLPKDAPKTEIEDLRRLPNPKELPERAELRVPYSLCDRNGHFSSANYVDLLCDAFGFWEGGAKRMARMQIDYHAEFLPGESLVLLGERDGGTVTARGAHADGKTGFLASLDFVEVED